MYCGHTNGSQLLHLITLQSMHACLNCNLIDIVCISSYLLVHQSIKGTHHNAYCCILRGNRNIHRDFPAPVAILTNTSLPRTRSNKASNWPGRKLGKLKYSWRAAFNLLRPTHSMTDASHSPFARGQLLQHSSST